MRIRIMDKKEMKRKRYSHTDTWDEEERSQVLSPTHMIMTGEREERETDLLDDASMNLLLFMHVSLSPSQDTRHDVLRLPPE